MSHAAPDPQSRGSPPPAKTRRIVTFVTSNFTPPVSSDIARRPPAAVVESLILPNAMANGRQQNAARTSRALSLAERFPQVAAEWHPSKNGKLTPADVTTGSRRRVWWLCAVGPRHEWQEIVSRRAWRRPGCPFCTRGPESVSDCLAVTAPDLASEWHPTKNGQLTPYDVVAGSHQIVWWRCSRNPKHVWKTPVHNRQGCPFCSNLYTSPDSSLARLRPELARQWHPDRNGALRSVDVVPGSNRRVWWKCAAGPDHEWRAMIAHRTREDLGCPFCSNRRLSITNCLLTRFPDLAAEWHPAKNGALGPREVLPQDRRPRWWKCTAGPDHEWAAPVFYRARLGLGCPFCAGRRLSVTNCLAARYPALAVQWHPTLNRGLTPHEVFPRATNRVWWRCLEGHEWRAIISARVTKQGGCPVCYRLRGRAPVTTRKKLRTRVYLPSDYS